MWLLMVVANAVALTMDEIVWQWLRPWPCPWLKSWPVACARADIATMTEVEAMNDAVAVAKEETMAVEVLAAAAAVGKAVALVKLKVEADTATAQHWESGTRWQTRQRNVSRFSPNLNELEALFYLSLSRRPPLYLLSTTLLSFTLASLSDGCVCLRWSTS